MKLLVVIFLILCFNSCTSPYKIVAGKANPTNKELADLAIACHFHFPVITNTFSIDSLTRTVKQDYTKQIDSLIDVVETMDSIIHEQIPIIDTAFVDSSNCLPRIQDCFKQNQKLVSERNTVQTAIIKLKKQLDNIKKDYRACQDSFINRTHKYPECDSAKMFLLQAQFKGKSDSLLIMTTLYRSKKDIAKNELWIIIALGISFVAGIVLKIKKVL